MWHAIHVELTTGYNRLYIMFWAQMSTNRTYEVTTLPHYVWDYPYNLPSLSAIHCPYLQVPPLINSL